MIDKIRERLQDVIDVIETYTVGRPLINNANISVMRLQQIANKLKGIKEAEYNNGWISVDDRLPETLDSYLVVVKMKYEWETEWEYQTDVAYYTMEDGYIDGWNTFNDWNEGQECRIVYWQPLPQSPKGE